ncbi:MAG: DHHW family protein [Christensenellales bacterium]
MMKRTERKEKAERNSNFIVTATFLIIVFALCAGNLISPLNALSYAERRKLAQPPKFTLETVLDGSAMGKLDEFLTDQFVFRESFRRLKALGAFYLLGRLDNNGIAIHDGSAIKLESDLREEAVLGAAQKISDIYLQYFEGMKVCYAIIPDKNYYIAPKGGYPALDYEKMESLLLENMHNDLIYIDIFDSLEAGSYYNTDPHWRQEELGGLISALCDALGIAPVDIGAYERHELSPFYGAYYGHSALPLSPDNMVYLTNPYTEAATAFNYETYLQIPVYSPELFSGMDPYDVYLSGATPLVEIESPLCKSGKELIIFRDSFGSSLAPLLLESYSKITLVDTRYMLSSLIGNYIDIDGQDVLFMYSAPVINNSEMLR